jgi:hypothetical protein
MVTDTTTTASSAISGFIAAVALDQSGAFGKQNSLEQFTTGTAELSSGNIVVRTFNSETSTFLLKVQRLLRPLQLLKNLLISLE